MDKSAVKKPPIFCPSASDGKARAAFKSEAIYVMMRPNAPQSPSLYTQSMRYICFPPRCRLKLAHAKGDK